MNSQSRVGARAAVALLLLYANAQGSSGSAQAPPTCNGDVIYRVNGETAAPPTLSTTGQPCIAGTACAVPCRPSRTTSCPDPCANQTTTDGNPSSGEHGGNGGDHLLPWLPIIGAIGVAVAADHLTGRKWVTPQELDANGPRFPSQQKIGRFQVQGYAAPGWPFAVDIDTEPGTATWLEVRYEGSNEPQYLDLTLPDGGRRVAVVHLPAGPGSLGIARYTLHSALLRQGHEPLYRPFRIYGLGAGPNAVGSLYLFVTAFGPTPAADSANVSWAVSAHRPFPLSRIEVLRVPGPGDDRFTRVTQSDINLLASSEAAGSLAALPVHTKVGAGTYELQARAWRTANGGGDWTGAYSPNYVLIQ